MAEPMTTGIEVSSQNRSDNGPHWSWQLRSKRVRRCTGRI